MATNKVFESGENPARSKDYNIPTTGGLDPESFRDNLEVANEFDYRKMVDLELFMNEMVLVEIPKSNNKNDDPFIFLGVNGTNQSMLRGKPQWIRRKYLETLLRSMPSTFETIEYFNQSTGNKAVNLVKTTGEKYQYRIHEDKNPIGRQWVRQVLSEPN